MKGDSIKDGILVTAIDPMNISVGILSTGASRTKSFHFVSVGAQTDDSFY